MNNWEEGIVKQKESEIEMLSNAYGGSMQDLALSSFIANTENLEHYKNEVGLLKNILLAALMTEDNE